MRKFGTCLTALILTSASAFADPAPLPAGKPAGVRQAQADGTAMIWLAGLGLVGLGIGLAVSGGDNNPQNSTSTVTTTGTSP